MRTQWCRSHIRETAEKCGLDDYTVARVERVTEFVEKHPQFCDCSTDAIEPLIKIRFDNLRDTAISLAEKRLSEKTPTGGKKHKSLTRDQIKQIIDSLGKPQSEDNSDDTKPEPQSPQTIENPEPEKQSDDSQKNLEEKRISQIISPAPTEVSNVEIRLIDKTIAEIDRDIEQYKQEIEKLEKQKVMLLKQKQEITKAVLKLLSPEMEKFGMVSPTGNEKPKVDSEKKTGLKKVKEQIKNGTTPKREPIAGKRK